jgi:cellulose synthase/poly-beta-1,6-N-acetylglucosamine synthase-like glycosyltransferase
MVHQHNAGVSAARNLGISLAHGEWVAFLDADDWLHPDHLASMVDTQKDWPDVDVMATRFLEMPDTEGSWPPNWPVFNAAPKVELITDLPRRWMAGPTFCTSSVAVRTRRLQQMQPCFPLNEAQAEDLDFWFRLAEQTSIALVHAPRVAYRVDVEKSLTTQSTAIKMLPSFERMHTRALSGALTDSQRESTLWFIAQHKLTLARLSLAAGKRRQGLKWLVKGHHAVSGKRWWMTAAMAFFLPQKFIMHWEKWRTNRKLFRVDISDAGR